MRAVHAATPSGAQPLAEQPEPRDVAGITTAPAPHEGQQPLGLLPGAVAQLGLGAVVEVIVEHQKLAQRAGVDRDDLGLLDPEIDQLLDEVPLFLARLVQLGEQIHNLLPICRVKVTCRLIGKD